MIKLESLSFSYGEEKVLDNINLEIKENTTLAIIGPSGCGKTTLLYIIAGLISPEKIEKGNLFTRGEIGIIFQNYGLFPWKSVEQNIILPLKAKGKDIKISKEISNNILKRLKVFELKDKYPKEISGGQKQRVAIGRTLALEPDILLMDEMSSALDAMTKEDIQDIIMEIVTKDKKSLIFVTHNIEEAVFLGQRIVVMNKGKIRSIVENSSFGKKDIRKSREFYENCIKIREILEEG